MCRRRRGRTRSARRLAKFWWIQPFMDLFIDFRPIPVPSHQRPNPVHRRFPSLRARPAVGHPGRQLQHRGRPPGGHHWPHWLRSVAVPNGILRKILFFIFFSLNQAKARFYRFFFCCADEAAIANAQCFPFPKRLCSEPIQLKPAKCTSMNTSTWSRLASGRHDIW
jgi:hypothetical protein